VRDRGAREGQLERLEVGHQGSQKSALLMSVTAMAVMTRLLSVLIGCSGYRSNEIE
jgi:hypothetical protein